MYVKISNSSNRHTLKCPKLNRKKIYYFLIRQTKYILKTTPCLYH
nr:MAG TPA: hypothetical protein [Bacteriophage sp.]